MKLKTLINSISNLTIPGAHDFEVKGLCYDSRLIKPGDLFFAIKGQNYDGHNFVADAEKKGAVGVVVERRVETHLPIIVVKDMMRVMSELANRFYDQPSHYVPVIGVTGTNGKTTTTYLLENAFRRMGKEVGVMGTINYRLGAVIHPASNTTPFSIDVHRFISEARTKNAHAVIMEVSSHALAQQRVDSVQFKVGVFTNLTQDHLDFHKDMESYFYAKKRLFKDFPGIRSVINIDDPYGVRLANELDNCLRFGVTENATLRATNIIGDLKGLRFNIHMPSGQRYPISTNLMGRHNAQNLLASAGALMAMGISEKDIVEGLNGVHVVPGRLERVEAGQDFVVVVDYAHTEDALVQVLNTLRDCRPERLLCVFGAGGDRDKAKRPKMGRAVVQLADYAFVTSDNPRSENPQAILNDIKAGIMAVGKNNYELYEDRANAIGAALRMAKKGDIVLIAGKGHETTQIIGTQKHHFSDQETALSFLHS